MTSNKSGGHTVDTDALAQAADDFNELAESIEKAVEFAGGGEVSTEHFGSFDAVQDSAEAVLRAKSALADSLAGLSGFTSDVSAKLDQAAGISDHSDSAGSQDFDNKQKAV